MKQIAFLLLMAILHIGTPSLAQRVSISGKDLPLEQVFTTIKKQTGFEFLYPADVLKAARPVTLHVRQMPVQEVLKRCLEGQELGFSIRSNTIVIFRQKQSMITEAPSKAPPDTLIYIKGEVVDFKGQPVEMASVVLLRTNTGTLTNRAGAFTLKVKDLQPADVLNISFVGLKGQTIRLNAKTSLGQIVLQSVGTPLDETVIIAYGTTSERFRTGDITIVKAADIEKVPALNALEALAGRVPGLYVRQNGGNPSSVYNIHLRGVNVMPAAITTAADANDAVNVLSKPLIVIDGLLMTSPDATGTTSTHTGVDAITGITGAGGGHDPLYWLNPLDIESLSVLKDAEATALYGSRAANGVIIITTKKGKPGKTSLSLSLNTGFNAQARRMKLMNTQQYLTMRREAWVNAMRAKLPVTDGQNIDYKPTPFNSYDLFQWDTTRYTDWQKVLLGAAPVHNANLELSGGEARTTWRLSAGYNRSKTSYPTVQGKPGFSEEKGSLSLNVSTNSDNKRFRMITSVLSSIAASHQPYLNPDRFVLLTPNAPALFDEMGNPDFAAWRPMTPFPGVLDAIVPNVLNTLTRTYHANRFAMLARTNLSYEVVRSLSVNVGLGYARSEAKQEKAIPASSFDPQALLVFRTAAFGNSTVTSVNVEPNARYEIRLKRHHFSLLAGASYQADKQEGNNISATGYTSDELMGTPATATTQMYGSHFIQRRSVSALARIAYRYADEFLIDLSARRDGSSSFGPGRRFGNFGSIGLGWIFTREHWANHIPLLTFGKIRGSYGVTGSQSANPYTYLSTFGISPAVAIFLPNRSGWYMSGGTYQSVPTYAINRIPNSMVGWAQAVSLDLGIDLYLLEDQRLKLSVQWYRKRTGNQLVTNPVSFITGATNYLANLPAKVQNSGVEATFDYTTPHSPAGVSWYCLLNIAVNKNKLHAFPGLQNSPLGSYYEVGQSLIRQRVYYSWLDTALGTYSTIDASHPTPVSYLVDNYPSLVGGMQAGISFKQFSLSVSCTFARQKGFTNIQEAFPTPGMIYKPSINNQSASLIKEPHWRSPADAGMAGALYAAGVNNSPLMDVYWGDASYIAIKNATLNYAFPKALLQQIGVRALNAYIRTENLLLLPLSEYKGVNPEQPGLINQLPLRRVLVGGFTINL